MSKRGEVCNEIKQQALDNMQMNGNFKEELYVDSTLDPVWTAAGGWGVGVAVGSPQVRGTPHE